MEASVGLVTSSLQSLIPPELVNTILFFFYLLDKPPSLPPIVVKFQTNYNKTTQFPLPKEREREQFSSRAYGLVINKLGNIYVSIFNQASIAVFSPKGDFLYQFGSNQLNTPCGLAIDRNSNILVADMQACAIKTWTSEGTLVSSIPTEQPFSVAVSTKGEIVVPEHSQISIYTEGGQLMRTFGENGTKEGQWDNDWGGCAIDNQGTTLLL